MTLVYALHSNAHIYVLHSNAGVPVSNDVDDAAAKERPKHPNTPNGEQVSTGSVLHRVGDKQTAAVDAATGGSGETGGK